MTENFHCPATDEACPTGELCAAANVPLEGIIPRVRREVGGIAWKYAETAVTGELTSAGDHVLANFRPTVDGDGSVRICPKDVLEGEFGQEHGPEKAIQAVGSVADRTVSHLIADLRTRRRQR